MGQQWAPGRTDERTVPVRTFLECLLVCVISLGALLGFVYLGQEVGEPATTTTDQHFLQRIADGTRSWPLRLWEAITFLGTGPVIITVALIVGLLLARGRRWWDGALLLGATVGAVLLSSWTKNIVARARPTDFFRIPASGYSFPSGHTLNATCLVLALGFILWRLPWRRATKIAGSFVLSLYVVAIGASRTILGVHYPTDVLGGFLLGVAWVTLLLAVILAISAWRRVIVAGNRVSMKRRMTALRR